jgi:hypothetical protein
MASTRTASRTSSIGHVKVKQTGSVVTLSVELIMGFDHPQDVATDALHTWMKRHPCQLSGSPQPINEKGTTVGFILHIRSKKKRPAQRRNEDEILR